MATSNQMYQESKFYLFAIIFHKKKTFQNIFVIYLKKKKKKKTFIISVHFKVSSFKISVLNSGECITKKCVLLF